MPIHSHHSPQSLKPEWIAEPRQEERCSIFVDDCFCDRGSERHHALRQPRGDAAAMKWKISNAGTFHGKDCNEKCDPKKKWVEVPVLLPSSLLGEGLGMRA